MRKVYLIGIGGIGMSALARYFRHRGDLVAGYDLTPSPLTHALEAEGIAVHYTDAVEDIPAPFRQDREGTLVIYTPAIPQDHKEWQWFRAQGYRIIKRSVALGHIARDHKCLAVAGTHGKTTTSTLLAHLLTQGGGGCTAFLGGISKNYGTNLLLSHAPALVAEADEFDRSFLQLYPQAAVITSADADHLDIYGSHEAVKEAFAAFSAQVQPGGTLLVKQGVDLPLHLAPEVKLLRYACDRPADFFADEIEALEGGYYRFTLRYPGGFVAHCRLGVPGRLNVENAVAAAALALDYGVPPQALREALASFAGVSRRMDLQYKSENFCYIDDYAHHPKELEAAITSVKAFYPGRRLTGIFQPHLFTRTRDFAADFGRSLALLDQVVLLPIYPARELPLAGVDSQMLLDLIPHGRKILLQPAEVLPWIKAQRPPVLLTLGAGNIDRLVPELVQAFRQLDGTEA